MKARILKINPEQPKEDEIRIVAEVLLDGGLAIIPTETVYGIAADVRNKETVSRLYEVKQRPRNKPFSLIIDYKERVEEFSPGLNRLVYKLIDRFWPGPLTLILPKKDGGTIGLRMPDNNIAQRVIAAVGSALVCPSANLSGKPSPVDFDEAIKDLGDKVEVAIDAGKARLGIESSIVDLTQTPYKILRQGALSAEEINQVANKKTVLFVCTGNSCRSVMAKAYLEKRLGQEKRSDIEVLSAGILGIPNLGVSPQTQQVLEKEGISAEEHRSLKINNLMIKKSDLILVMEKMHEERISELVPEAKNRVFLLKEFARMEGSSLDIEDPIGQPLEFHERTFSIIKEAVERILKIL
jgi:tRNA threonylcarbamoyl adenosine modification protein (Sua5/YciO/YrdC/YwlC family)